MHCSGVDVYTALARVVGSLYGPLHGGANEVGYRVMVQNGILVAEGKLMLIYAASGGVGSLLCQWANKLAEIVIGDVCTKKKPLQAKEDGCHHVIMC